MDDMVPVDDVKMLLQQVYDLHWMKNPTVNRRVMVKEVTRNGDGEWGFDIY